jgi:hypothetical protein
MSDIAEVRDLFSDHDPIARRATPLDEMAVERMWRGLLDDIERGTVPAARPPARRQPALARVAVVIVIVAACVLAGLVVAGREHSPSATHYLALQPLDYSRSDDPQPAATMLRQLAAVAESQPASISSGWYYLETASWSTFNGSGPNDAPAGMPNVLEQWINPDGSQRVVNHVDLPAPTAGLDAWLHEGLPLSGGRTETHTITAAKPQFPSSLSTEPPLLQQQLLDAELGSDHSPGPPTNVELLTALEDLRAQQPIEPALQAAVLEVLANQPDMLSLGTATDRLGRIVDAVAIDSDYSGLATRYVLLFDPTDGQLVGSEDVLIKRAGSLDVAVPSVISYVIYVRDGHVRDETSSPPPL